MADSNGLTRWSLERWVQISTLVISALAFTFGIGVNYARISDTAARQDASEKIFLRSDVYQADQRRLSESIERLNRNLERIESAYAATSTQHPPDGRRFDR